MCILHPRIKIQEITSAVFLTCSNLTLTLQLLYVETSKNQNYKLINKMFIKKINNIYNIFNIFFISLLIIIRSIHDIQFNVKKF